MNYYILTYVYLFLTFLATAESILRRNSSSTVLKYFYSFYVQKHMQKEFPQTVSYNRFVELMQSNLMTMDIDF